MGLRHGHFQPFAILAMIFMIFGSTFAKPDDASDDVLVKLARKQQKLGYNALFDKERSAFDMFFLKVHQGKAAEFTPKVLSQQDVAAGNSWGAERTVKAEWIMWLCSD